MGLADPGMVFDSVVNYVTPIIPGAGVAFYGSTSGRTAIIAPAVALSTTYVLPSVAPSDGQVLAWHTGGLLTWDTVSSSSIPYTGVTNVPSGNLLGRTTAGTGAAEAIGIGSGLSLAALSLSVDTTVIATKSYVAANFDVSGAAAAALSTAEAYTDSSLSTFTGTTHIVTLGTIAIGTWSGTAIADNKIASDLTGKTYNSLTLTAAAIGFTIAGGTASKTLTIPNTLTLTASDGSTLAIGTGGTLGTAAYTNASAYEVPLTFSSGVSRAVNAISLDQSFSPTWTGVHIWSKNGALSTPTVSLIGSAITGGTTTTCKPLMLVEPTGTTSNNWSMSGTYFGINAGSGFTGNMIDVQMSGVRFFAVNSAGLVAAAVTGKIDGSTQFIGLSTANELRYFPGATMRIRQADTIQAFSSGYIMGWSAGAATAALDTGIARNGIGVMEVNNGSAGSFADLKAANITGSGTIKGAGYQSSDGSNGATGSFTAGANTVTVKNGLVTNIA